jgi:hypothetical protein
MAHDPDARPDRRAFLQAGALAATAAALPASGRPVQDQAPDAPAGKAELPRRVLGKTGVQVTMID